MFLLTAKLKVKGKDASLIQLWGCSKHTGDSGLHWCGSSAQGFDDAFSSICKAVVQREDERRM